MHSRPRTERSSAKCSRALCVDLMYMYMRMYMYMYPCIYVCVCVCICIYIYVYACIRVYVYMYICIYVCIYTSPYAFLRRVCMHAQVLLSTMHVQADVVNISVHICFTLATGCAYAIDIDIDIYICTHTYIDICICICTCIYVRICIEQIELQAKLLNYFLGSNKSNINQYVYMCIYILSPTHTMGCVCVCVYVYVCVCMCVCVCVLEYMCTRTDPMWGDYRYKH